MDRRSLITALMALPLSAAAAPAKTPAVAITIDDFNLVHDGVMSGEMRDDAIRKVLKTHGITAAGFVAGRYIDADVAPRVLKAWSDDGHVLGNHTFAHAYYSGSDPDGYMADILKCEALLKAYPGFRKVFRYPFLAEGRPPRAATPCAA